MDDAQAPESEVQETPKQSRKTAPSRKSRPAVTSPTVFASLETTIAQASSQGATGHLRTLRVFPACSGTSRGEDVRVAKSECTSPAPSQTSALPGGDG